MSISNVHTNLVQNGKEINDTFAFSAADHPQNVGNNESSSSIEQKRHFRKRVGQLELELADSQQMCEAVKHENKLLRMELNHQKLLTEHYALQAKVAAMEKGPRKGREMELLYDQVSHLKEEQEKICAKSSELEQFKATTDQVDELRKDQKNLLERISTESDHQQNNFETLKGKLYGKIAETDRNVEELKKQFGNVSQCLQQQNDQQSLVEGLIEFEKEQQILRFDHLKANQWEMCGKIAKMEKTFGELKDQFEKVAHLLLEKSDLTSSPIPPNPSPPPPPPNCWDVKACHKELEISGPNCETITYKAAADGNKYLSAIAEFPILNIDCGFFYFEVTILSVKSRVAIGFAPKEMPLDCFVGGFPGSFSYTGDGYFWTNASYRGNMLPAFSRNDVIGCGICLTTRRFIFTKNGQRLDTAKLAFCSSNLLFPCVSLRDSDDTIEANFGPTFKFGLSA
ncbi:hypothetical protein niasHT_009031 [Heterodera trifolii]|uniref:B30.2/SPRY domain-containing protein n=1 Tax=Heterodera trifolii TaxID=157864 RepID=A0ABD2M560_9BILA